MVRRATRSLLLMAVVGAAALIGAGCSTEDERTAARHAELMAAGQEAAAAELFHVTAQLRHRTAGTRWRAPAALEFPVRDESFVRADVTLHNLRPHRTYSVHLAWIRPDGREMFRRHAEVTRHEIGLPPGVEPDSLGALPARLVKQWRDRFGADEAASLAARFAADPATPVPVNEIVYKRAIDLHFAQRSVSVDAEPRASLNSRLDISRDRQRQPGQYHLRIYLDRRLLQEIPFLVAD
jgi:hypothetical protein